MNHELLSINQNTCLEVGKSMSGLARLLLFELKSIISWWKYYCTYGGI